MKTEHCPSLTAHGRHEWYWKNILRRDCLGITVAFCGKGRTHSPHRHGEYQNEFCRGLGLAGICEHGVQMLSACDHCPSGNPVVEGDVDALMGLIVADVEDSK